MHKYNAYRKAVGVLAKHPTRIKSGAEAKKLASLSFVLLLWGWKYYAMDIVYTCVWTSKVWSIKMKKKGGGMTFFYSFFSFFFFCQKDGIGEKIAKKIDEFIDTGSLKKLEKVIKNKTEKPFVDLKRIYLIVMHRGELCPKMLNNCVQVYIFSLDSSRWHQCSY